MAKSGGPAALRGFRLQTLYILHRALNAHQQDVFRPEGEEDLDVHRPGHSEFIQVKAYSEDLTLNKLAAASTKKQGRNAEPPFLKRALTRIQQHEGPQVLLSFGAIGKELQEAWAGPGAARDRVIKKLDDLKYTLADCDLLFQHVQLQHVSEDDLYAEARAHLRNTLAAGQPDYAIDVLSQHIQRTAEQQGTFTSEDFQTWLAHYGENDVHVQDFHQAWGRTLHPVIPKKGQTHPREKLLRDYRLGVNATLDHIVENLDVPRPDVLQQIEEAFEENNLVVITGASGQGKSTLAYRFLHSHCPRGFTFELKHHQDLKDLHEATSALQGLMAKVNVPITVYLDVRPGVEGWMNVMGELSNLSGLRLLVTLREEDWGRVAAIAQQWPLARVELQFTRTEALGIYEGLLEHQPPKEHLDFEEAWLSFGGKGPLLEFVYVLNHNQNLRHRLTEQMQHLRKEWGRDESVLDFLHAATVATAYHAQANIERLRTALKLSKRHTAEIVARLKEEYLLRPTEDAQHLEGLHAVRSQLLSEVLAQEDPTLLYDAASVAFDAIKGEDLEVFLLHVFLNFPDHPILERVQGCKVTTFQEFAGVMRALMWVDVQNHIQLLRPVMEEAREKLNSDWYLFVAPDITGLSEKGLLIERPEFGDLTVFPQRMRDTIKATREKMVPERAAFQQARTWLASLPEHHLNLPQHGREWAGFAEVAFWSGMWEVSANTTVLQDISLDTTRSLTFQQRLEVFFGLTFLPNWREQNQLMQLRQALDEEFRDAAGVLRLSLDESTHTITIDFIVPDAEDPLPVRGINHDDLVHRVTLNRLMVLRQLYPEFTHTISQGHGHRNPLLELHDESHKEGVGHHWFPPSWGLRWNRVFVDAFNLELLPETWEDYHNLHFELRRNVLAFLKARRDDLSTLVDDPKKLKDQQHTGIVALMYTLSSPFLRETIQLPKCVFDQWGLMGKLERTLHQSELSEREFAQRNVHIPEMHRPFIRAEWDFHSSLQNYFRDATDALPVLSHLHQPRGRDAMFKVLLKLRVKNQLRDIHLSRINLSDALERLPRYQQEFRQRFEQYSSKTSLDELEAEETQTLKELWDHWGFLSTIHLTSIKRTSEAHVQHHTQELQKAFTGLKELHQDFEVSVLGLDHGHGNTPTLWIKCGVPSLFQDDLCLHQVYQTICAVWNQIPRDLQPLVGHSWSNVVIIPCIGDWAWQQQVYMTPVSLLTHPEKLGKIYLYTPVHLGDEHFTRWNINVLEPEEGGWVEEVRVVLSELLGHANRLDQYAQVDLPEGQAKLQAVCEKHIAAHSTAKEHLHQLAQKFSHPEWPDLLVAGVNAEDTYKIMVEVGKRRAIQQGQQLLEGLLGESLALAEVVKVLMQMEHQKRLKHSLKNASLLSFGQPETQHQGFKHSTPHINERNR